MAKAIVLAEGHLGGPLAKTANGLVRHAMNDHIIAVIDSTRAGEDAGEVVAGRPAGIPVVPDLGSALALGKAEVLYIGVATIGGVLPTTFRKTIGEALAAGLTVVNGLHTFLSEDPEFAKLVGANGARIVDVRKAPTGLRVADGRVHDLTVPRVLVMGMDCDIGKRTTVVELVRLARERGIDAGFVATGQTGCMLGPDAGAVIDRIPSDFCAGQVERMVTDVAARRGAVFVYGQASILHPAYSAVALAILHGAAPNAVVLQVAPGRTHRILFEHPAFAMAEVEEEIDLIERLGTGRVVALAVNTTDAKDAAAACRELERRTGLPAADPVSGGAGRILDAVTTHLGTLDSFVARGPARTSARAATRVARRA